MAHREGVPRTRPRNRDFLGFCVFGGAEGISRASPVVLARLRHLGLYLGPVQGVSKPLEKQCFRAWRPLVLQNWRPWCSELGSGGHFWPRSAQNPRFEHFTLALTIGWGGLEGGGSLNYGDRGCPVHEALPRPTKHDLPASRGEATSPLELPPPCSGLETLRGLSRARRLPSWRRPDNTAEWPLSSHCPSCPQSGGRAALVTGPCQATALTALAQDTKQHW